MFTRAIFRTWLKIRNGQNLFLSGRPAASTPARKDFTFSSSKCFSGTRIGLIAGLNGFVTFVVSPDEDKSPIPYYLNGGLIYEGLIPCRPNDKTALGFYSAWFSERQRSAQKAAGAAVTNERNQHRVQSSDSNHALSLPSA